MNVQRKCGSMRRWQWAVACIALTAGQAWSQTLELYADAATNQVFTEPGPNRVRLGAFARVDESAPAPAVALAAAQPAASATSAAPPQPAASSAPVESRRRAWYDRLSLRGYTQLRYNEVLDDELEPYQHYADRSLAPDQSLLLRRGRLVISGDINDRVSLYIQPDFAVTPPGSSQTHFLQLRDAYADVYLDRDKDWRVRLGQSKVPFGFENLQSSQNRPALDRNDAFNSCCKDERDLGAFFYWTPPETRALFQEIADLGLKHSGNYGLVGVGLYNGQGANRFDSNGDFHWVARASKPWKLANGQIVEFGLQALGGRFMPTVDNAALLAGAPENGFEDRRVGVSAMWYPQPFGLQAEWNWGDGPALSTDRTSIGVDSLDGGYVQAMYRLETKRGVLMPFVKWQRFEGAMKFERNAPRTDVTETELGLEWQFSPALELTTMYVMSDRTNVLVAPYEQLSGDILRFQMQWNY
jgi:hypothetical protein